MPKRMEVRHAGSAKRAIEKRKIKIWKQDNSRD